MYYKMHISFFKTVYMILKYSTKHANFGVGGAVSTKAVHNSVRVIPIAVGLFYSLSLIHNQKAEID